jgi:CHAT domain-containing protein
MLIVANPSGDLPGAEREREIITAFFRESTSPDEFDIQVSGPGDDEFELLRKMKHCQILHFAGHALFGDRGGDSSRSGWLLRADVDDSEPASVLRASMLADVWKGAGPLLVFANGCESARTSPRALRKPVDSDAALGLAQAFLSAGASNYIGTVWNAPDSESTSQFAAVFYRELLNDATVSRSLYQARVDSAERYGEEDLTWARYIHCGDPFARLRDRPRWA